MIIGFVLSLRTSRSSLERHSQPARRPHEPPELEAFDRLEVLEATAEEAITARSIGDPVTMSDAVVGQLTELLAALRNSPRQ